jgi:hypothetical protein
MKLIITERQEKLLEMELSIRRRLNQIEDFLFNLMDGMYVCDYDDDVHFMEGVKYNAEDYFTDFNDFNGMDKEDFLGTLENEFTDEIYNYYERQCSGDDEYGSVEETNFVVGDLINEAEYQGRKVQLGKPFLTPKGPKKRSVYVKNEKGNVVKVNFGDPNMRIKAYSPKHRKSFRARHNCDNPGPKYKSRYWSCRAW